MKRVLFIASQPYFSRRGSPIRLGFDMLALSQLGYTVDFLTLPIGENRDTPNVRVIRAPNIFFARKIPIGPSPLKLAFDAILFFMAFGRVILHKYAVIHAVEDCALPALILSKLTRTPFIFERHSDPTSHKSKGKLRNILLNAYARVERFVMRRADATVVTGPGLVPAFAKARASVIPDIPSSLAEADLAAVAGVRARCRKNDDEILACYVGSFAVYQGIDLLFDSIPKALEASPNLRFVIIGGTPKEIDARREQLGDFAKRVSFLGFVDPDDLPSYLAAMDILLSPRISGMNTPLKLLDYLKASAAIVATDCPANKLILTPAIAEFAPLNPEGFASAVVRLAADSERRSALVQGGKAVLDEAHNFGYFKNALRQTYDYAQRKTPNA